MENKEEKKERKKKKEYFQPFALNWKNTFFFFFQKYKYFLGNFPRKNFQKFPRKFQFPLGLM